MPPHQLDFLALLKIDSAIPSAPSKTENHIPVDGLFLPGLPVERIRRCYDLAAGNEINSGKFRHPESSAALVANSFGFFLDRPSDLPPIPGCEGCWSTSLSVSLEATVQFPWREGRHPCLDALVVTERYVIGIESKRYEPYRDKIPAHFSNAYWRPVWGKAMDGYEFVRDILKSCNTLFTHLDAAQLVKHALGLRTAALNHPEFIGKVPVLVYVYAEPSRWPDGRALALADFKKHRREIDRFSKCVADAEVVFRSISYSELLQSWQESSLDEISDHAAAIVQRFAI
jgi:hypothetical protein